MELRHLRYLLAVAAELRFSRAADGRVIDRRMKRHQTQERVMTQQVDKQLVDAATDAYVEWRQECAAVRDAYERWAHARDIDAAGAFLVYRAALDREESASHAYADLLGVAAGQGQTEDLSGRAVHALGR